MASARRTGTNESISTYAASGADYSVLATWESATDNDNVSGAVSPVLECAAAQYDDFVEFLSATNGTRYFRIIRPNSSSYHNGVRDTGVRFYNTAANTTILPRESYSQVQDLVLRHSYDGSSIYTVFCSAGHKFFGCIGCIATGTTNASGPAHGFYQWTNSTSDSAYFIDCLAENCDDNGFFVKSDAEITSTLYNCTAVGNGSYGFNCGASATITQTNCLGSGNTTADWTGSIDSGSNNASSDASALGTSPRINQTFTFLGGTDYRLAFSDAGAQNVGTNLSADATYAFDDDIVGRKFDTWDIGCYEPRKDSARHVGARESISTFASAGADYSSLSTWEADTDNDNVGTSVSPVVECAAGEYDNGINMGGATNDVAYFRIVRPNAGGYHTGIRDTGVRLYFDNASNATHCGESFSQFQDLCIRALHTTGDATDRAGGGRGGTGTTPAWVGCIFTASLNNGSGLSSGWTTLTATSTHLIDCVAENNENDGFNIGAVAATVTLYNCTAVSNAVYGFDCNATATIEQTNCLGSGNTTADWNGSIDSGSHNRSSDGTAPDNPTSYTFTFVNAAGYDYHLASGDTGAKDLGTDLSGSTYTAIEREPPDGIVTALNFNADFTVANLDDDPDAPDANWATWDGNGNVDGQVDFATPSASLVSGADLQQFQVWVRKDATGGQSVTYSLELWTAAGGGAQVRVLGTGTLADSTAGEMLTGTWNATEVASAADVRCRILQTGGGTGASRRGMEVGAIEWNASVSLTTAYAFDDDIDRGAWVTWDIGFDEPDSGAPPHALRTRALQLNQAVTRAATW